MRQQRSSGGLARCELTVLSDPNRLRRNSLHEGHASAVPLRIEDTSGFRGCVRIGRETAGPSTTLRSGRDDNSVVPARASARNTWPHNELQQEIPGLATELQRKILGLATELSSRPKRSVLEGPAVSLPVLTHPLKPLRRCLSVQERTFSAACEGRTLREASFLQPVEAGYSGLLSGFGISEVVS
jgi:hypothetical protein